MNALCLLIFTESLITANWEGQFKQAQRSSCAERAVGVKQRRGGRAGLAPAPGVSCRCGGPLELLLPKTRAGTDGAGEGRAWWVPGEAGPGDAEVIWSFAPSGLLPCFEK